MGFLALICFFAGLISLGYFISFLFKKIKSKINKEKFDFELGFPFDFYKKKPLIFLIGGLMIIILTFFTYSPSIMSLIFTNNLRYKPEGTYCYYVIDKNKKAYPAKIEKTSEIEEDGEDYFGNPTSTTHIYVYLLELFVEKESYEFYDEPLVINSDKFTTITYYNEGESDDGDYQEIEKNFDLKLTNDVAYCPSFGKGNTKINYLELGFEVLILLSEISMFIITIYFNRKEKENE